MHRVISLSIATIFLVPACGSAAPRSPVDPAGAEPPSLVLANRLPPVQAGSYRLSISVRCAANERTATGLLTLKRISGSDGVLNGSSLEPAVGRAGEGALLWGQADVDFDQLETCLGASTSSSSEPIHPSVLVDVLRWDGGSRQQVLLVSTDARRGGTARSSAGVGIAMRVESVDHGHLTGIWSRWELMGEAEGHWEADLVEGDGPR